MRPGQQGEGSSFTGLRNCKSREAGEAGEVGEADKAQRQTTCKGQGSAYLFHPWGEISFHLTQLVKGKVREILGSQNLKIKGGSM